VVGPNKHFPEGVSLWLGQILLNSLPDPLNDLSQDRNYFEDVAYNPIIGNAEDGCILILVDGHNTAGT